MARNAVQFQKGMSLAEFQARFGSEEQCEKALVGGVGLMALSVPAAADARIRLWAGADITAATAAVTRPRLRPAPSSRRRFWP